MFFFSLSDTEQIEPWICYKLGNICFHSIHIWYSTPGVKGVHMTVPYPSGCFPVGDIHSPCLFSLLLWLPHKSCLLVWPVHYLHHHGAPISCIYSQLQRRVLNRRWPTIDPTVWTSLGGSYIALATVSWCKVLCPNCRHPPHIHPCQFVFIFMKCIHFN